MVLHKIEAMGVQVLTHCSPTRQLTRVVDGNEVFCGFELQDGKVHEADLVIYAIGIRPRDDVARASGINCHSRGGIVVGDDLSTSAEDVYAIGECASWRENSYGLIGPGSELSSFNVDLFSCLQYPFSRNGRHSVVQPYADRRSCSTGYERSRPEYEAKVSTRL